MLTIYTDKIHISFYIDVDTSDILLYLSHNSYITKDNTTHINHAFELQKDVYYDNTLLGSILFKHRTVKGFCKFQFTNKVLYTNKNDVIKFAHFLLNSSEFIDTSICALEIAIDTDTNILKRYNRLLKNQSIKLDKNYQSDYYSTEYLNNNYIRNIDTETKYIIDKKCQFSKDVIVSKKRYLRIENKKNLIENNPNRGYIKNYLIDNKIDLSGDYFRFELILPVKESFISSNNAAYYNLGGAYVTNYVYQKALKTIEKYNNKDVIIFGSSKDFDNAKKIIDEYKTKSTLRTIIDIDIDQIFDKHYLYNLFTFYAEKIIYNLSSVVQLSYKKTTIKMKTMDKKPKTKSIKNDYDNLEIQSLNYLHRRKLISDNDYNDVMERIDNNYNELDIFS